MKPKEYWLDIATACGDPCDFISEGKPHKTPAATNIHVIEYSAFEKAIEALKDMVAVNAHEAPFYKELAEKTLKELGQVLWTK
jgi:hypothetical protein